MTSSNNISSNSNFADIPTNLRIHLCFNIYFLAGFGRNNRRDGNCLDILFEPTSERVSQTVFQLTIELGTLVDRERVLSDDASNSLKLKCGKYAITDLESRESHHILMATR